MKNLKRKTALIAIVLSMAAAGAVSLLAPAPASAIDCSIVRCPGCPDGYVFKPTGGNCCRCVPAKP